MKHLFFILACTINLLIFSNHIRSAQKESIVLLQEQYIKIREKRELALFPEAAQAYNNLQANPESKDLQETFHLYKKRLDACDAAMLQLRPKAFPQPLVLIVPTDRFTSKPPKKQFFLG